MSTATAGPRLDNLPIALSTFVGRERESAEIQHALSAHRLLTLIGPGGCGKTRLAVRVAEALRTEFAEGVWLTEFAPLADDALVPQAVASALGIREQPGQPLTDTLTAHLQSRHTLLILDNCEHLVAACAQIAEVLLHACAELRILATSREPLAVLGEGVWSVPPLSLPDPHPWRSPTSEQAALPDYQQSEAVRLFVARAQSAWPIFSLTPDNGRWIAEICRRLDGMPLAIELAAARVRALSVQQIAERLDNRFSLLTSGSRTAPPRHQTLAATLDWSYALLSETERNVLQRLSVFAGGGTLEAAEAVCAEKDEVEGMKDEVHPSDVLDTLSHLVDKSLVVTDPSGGEPRYRLLETIRQYAREKLNDSGKADEARDRHLDYYLHWAEQAEPCLAGLEQLLWLNQFEAEHDNLRAALEWSLRAEPDAAYSLKLAAACGFFWRLRGYLSEGHKHLAAALARGGAQAPAHRARALGRAANIVYLQSNYPEARSLCEESLRLWRTLGEAGNAGVAYALDVLGEIATEEGDYVTAPNLFAEVLALCRELNDTGGVGNALIQFGWVALRTGNYELAKQRFEEALTILRQTGYITDIAFSLAGLGEVAVRLGQYDHASTLLDESLALRRAHGDKWGIGTSLGTMGWVALRQRDYPRMRSLLRDSIIARTETGDRGGIAWCLEKLAEAAYLQRKPERAVRVFGAAAVLRAPVKSVIDPADQPEYNHIIAALKVALGAETFAALWAEGSALPVEQIVDDALSDDADSAVSPQEKERFGGLTAREREVAALIAQGKSNREIAAAMVVGVKTVETYVTRILNKLGFDSRVQIATWAKDKGLA
ncbi:MAG: tetratricopeptide repeat protein [Anaerolineales bacterium]